MSLENTWNIALSGINAQSIRMNTIASNIANADSVGNSTSPAYKAKHPVFKEILDKQNLRFNGGVTVSNISEDTNINMKYDPQNPLAENGYVQVSNVKVADEMVDLVETSKSYQMNLSVFNETKRLMYKLLDLGATS